MDTSADRGRSKGKARRAELEDEDQEDLRLFQPEEGDTCPPFKPWEGNYRSRWKEGDKGKSNVITVNNLDTSATTAHRNERTGHQHESSKHERKDFLMKNRQMPFHNR